MEWTKVFAERIRELRNEKGLSAQKLSVAIGASHGAVAFWEQCRYEPKVEFVLKLANYFGVSTDYLLGREN